MRGKSTPIPGTLLISAISVIDDVHKAVSMYAKRAGNLIYVVGNTRDELGGSHYYDLYNSVGNQVPKVYPKESLNSFIALSKASEKGLVKSIHDCSDGGLAVALAEMAFSGGLGMQIFLGEVPCVKSAGINNEAILFSESNSRLEVEVEKARQKDFEKQLKGRPFGLAGCLTDKTDFKIYNLDGEICVDVDVSKLKEAWKKPLRW
ncbi:MAG: AIR synthase-related protein [Candidatus Omnitrophica bacterium]|nr:AIR synthase-related protein [Candidatus Omnitrophota bacterium]